jgi:hypothetical protein
MLLCRGGMKLCRQSFGGVSAIRFIRAELDKYWGNGFWDEKWMEISKDLVHSCVLEDLLVAFGRAIAQAVSRRLPTAAARVQTRVWSCRILWWTKVAKGQVSPANLHSICFSTIIFTITRGWHNRPGVAAVAIASQTKIIIIVALQTQSLLLENWFKDHLNWSNFLFQERIRGDNYRLVAIYIEGSYIEQLVGHYDASRKVADSISY